MAYRSGLFHSWATQELNYLIIPNLTEMDSREEHPMRFGFRCKIVGVENNGVFIGVDGITSPLTRDLSTQFKLDDPVIVLMKPIW